MRLTDVAGHFAEVGKMVGIGSGAQKNVIDYKPFRYACYLADRLDE